MIIPAQYKDAANQAARQISPNAAPITFGGFGLSASGNAPATHYWAAGDVDGLVGQIEEAWLQNFPLAHIEEYDPSSNPSRPANFLTERGLTQIVFVP